MSIGNCKTYSTAPNKIAFLVEDHRRSPIASIASRLIQIVIRLDEPVPWTYLRLVKDCNVPGRCFQIWPLRRASAEIYCRRRIPAKLNGHSRCGTFDYRQGHARPLRHEREDTLAKTRTRSNTKIATVFGFRNLCESCRSRKGWRPSVPG